ncbi:MAG: SRPBCC family protein [Gammaproteobacteria bacterium]
MKRFWVGLALLSAAASGHCAGDAPVLTVTRSVEIAAPAGEVWERVKDFDGLNKWHPAVAKAEIVEGGNNAPGAVRLLTLGDGGTIREKLLAYDAKGRSMKYNILEGVLPVSSYESTIKVEEASKQASKVTWAGSFKRKDTGPAPAKDADDATATSTIEGVYQGGLDNLKKISESK